MSKKFLSILLLPGLAAAADPVLLRKVAGTVEIKASESAAWSQAQAGAQLPSGGKLRTGADGRAELKFKNKASVWLKPSTSVAIEQKSAKHNRVNLASGMIKVRVPHLRFREKFDVKTPLAVASVRGTVFSMGYPGDAQTASLPEESAAFLDKYSSRIDAIKAMGGTPVVECYFGQVDYQTEDDSVDVKIPQGLKFEGNALQMLTQLDEVAGLEDWTPGVSDEQRVAELRAFAENRQEVRDFAEDALARNAELVDSLADRVKENDFAAGRTLTDVNGNLVRVEQRLDRPAADVIQVVNVTLRKSYAYDNSRRYYKYSGGSTSRVDALIAKADFNMALPDSLTEFPGFFSANEDALKIDHASLVAANLSNPQEIGVVAFLGDRPSLATPGASDDIDADLYVGDIVSATDVLGRTKLFNLTATNAAGAGLTKYVEDTGMDSINFDAPGGELYSRTAKRFIEDGNPSNKIWLTTENHVINNSGQVRNISDYTGGGANYQDLLTDSAGQSILSVRVPDPFDAGKPLQTTSGGVLANGKNIDLVVIPDLFYSIVKTMATSADAFKTTY